MDDAGNNRRGGRLILCSRLGSGASSKKATEERKESLLRNEAPAGVVQEAPKRERDTEGRRAGEDHTNTQVATRAQQIRAELAVLQHVGHAHGGRRPLLIGPGEGGGA